MGERGQHRGLRDVTLSDDGVTHRPAAISLAVCHGSIDRKRAHECRGYPGNFLLPPRSYGGPQYRPAMIRFDLSIDLDYNVLTASDFVFVIQPANTPHQRVTWERLSIEPALPH